MATILIVDDDPVILRLCCRILRGGAGLDVLQANDGVAALAAADRYCGSIDVLLSDVAMLGGITGPQLAEMLTTSRPGMKVVLMSGNYEGLASDRGWHFLSKPFLPADLLSKIKEMLAGAEKQKAPALTSRAAGQTAA